MKTIVAERACGILYRFLKSYKIDKPFLLPSNVCHVVPMTFLTAGISFEFVDINRDTLCADETICLDLLKTDKYAGLLFVRTYGSYYDTSDFFCDIKHISNNLLIIDDRCLCKPSLCYEKNNADIQLYSTGYSKYIELNRGAFAFVENDGVGDKMMLLPDLTFDDTIDVEEIVKQHKVHHSTIISAPDNWLNTLLITGVESEIYFESIKSKINETDNHKKRINDIYASHLSRYVLNDLSYNQWRFNIIVRNKAKLLETIFSNSLFASSHYFPANRIFESSAITPNSDWLYENVINLFNDFHFTIEKAEFICDTITKHELYD